MKRLTFLMTSFMALSALLAAPAKASDTATLEALIDGAHRTDAEKARNKYRHPVETLTFFGLKPDMTVVEISPSGGWYAGIIAPFVRDKGHYYAAGPARAGASDYAARTIKAFDARLAANPALYDKVRITELTPPNAVEIAPPGSADMVVTFRNLHNMMGDGTVTPILKAVYQALKPGGIFGVVDHRGDSTKPQDPKAASGYVNQEYAIKLIEEAGFKLVDASEVNANRRDTKDYPKGVWTLPPSFALKDQDRAKYATIGESDRFTLKFIKPVK